MTDSTPEHISYLCILDFEATCDDNKGWSHEIIEFPSVLLKWNTHIHPPRYEEISRFQEYCRPLHKPEVTKFCYELTGITQQQVDTGHNLPDTYKRHFQWLRDQIPNFPQNVYDNPEQPPVILVTCGRWDMFDMFPPDCIRWDIRPDIFYRQVINLKKPFCEHYPEAQRMGMAGMLNYLNLKLEGRHHSGIDDCHNIGRIVQKLQQDGYIWNWNHMEIVPTDFFKRQTKNKKKLQRKNDIDFMARQARFLEQKTQ